MTGDLTEQLWALRFHALFICLALSFCAWVGMRVSKPKRNEYFLIPLAFTVLGWSLGSLSAGLVSAAETRRIITAAIAWADGENAQNHSDLKQNRSWLKNEDAGHYSKNIQVRLNVPSREAVTHLLSVVEPNSLLNSADAQLLIAIHNRLVGLEQIIRNRNALLPEILNPAHGAQLSAERLKQVDGAISDHIQMVLPTFLEFDRRLVEYRKRYHLSKPTGGQN